jgi:hypothetical protein
VPAENTPRQEQVARALAGFPLEAMRNHTIGNLLRPDRRTFLDAAAGRIVTIAGNAEVPAGDFVELTADDIPPAYRPPEVPDTPAGL